MGGDLFSPPFIKQILYEKYKHNYNETNFVVNADGFYSNQCAAAKLSYSIW